MPAACDGRRKGVLLRRAGGVAGRCGARGNRSTSAGADRLGRRRGPALAAERSPSARIGLRAAAAGHRGRRAGLDVARRRPAAAAAKLVVRQRSPRTLRRRGPAGFRPADGEAAGATLGRPTTPPRPAGCRDPAGRSVRRVCQQGTGRPRQPPAGDACAGRSAPRAAGARQSGFRAGRDAEVRGRAARPALARGKPARRSRFNCSAAAARSFGRSSTDLPADRAATIPVEVPLPDEEGVYDVAITAANSANWSQAVRQPLNWKRTIAERRVQVLVLDGRGRRPPRAERELAQVAEIDPANPRWYEKLSKLSQLQLASQAAATDCRGLVERRAGQRLPAIAAARAGRAGRVETQRRLARRELGGLLAADQPARPAAHAGSRLSQRRAADAGAEHRRAERRRGDGAADGGRRAWTTPADVVGAAGAAALAAPSR